MLLFKRILESQKNEGGLLDKRGGKRYPVGSKYPLKAKITLTARDGEGNPLPAQKSLPMDWGGQLLNLSPNGASIRLHPAAVAARGEACTLKLELEHMLFEVDGTVATYRTQPQHVTCGMSFNFPDSYTQRAYQQLMAPVVVGSTLAAGTARVKQDLPGLTKEEYVGEAESALNVWKDGTGKTPRLFELLIHDYFVRGNTELPGLKIGYRDGAKIGRRVSTPSFPVPMSADHQAEVARLFQYVVQNLTRSVPSDVRRFVELFAT